jgi:hypothetical protein
VNRRDLPAVAVLLGLALLLWSPVLTRPGTIAFGLDLVQFFYWEHYARIEMAQGVVPLWNPYVQGGVPFLANPQTRLFYPPALLFRLLPIEFSFGWSLALHTWLAGLAMYLLMRKWGSSPWGGFFAAIALMMGGFLVPRIYGGHVDIIEGLCWTPLALLLASRALTERSPLAALGAGTALALQFLSGFVPMVFYSGLLLLGYAVWWLIGRLRAGERRAVLVAALHMAAVAGTALVLAAVQLLPTLELVGWSNRSGGLELQAADLGSFRFRHFVTLFAPHFFYDPVNHLPFPDELIWERCGYVGLLPLLLAPWAVRTRQRRAGFWAGVSLVGVAMALGSSLPFYGLLWRVVPFFRIPGQFLLFWVLGTAALAGLAVDVLVERPEALRRWLNLISAGLLSLAAVAAVLRLLGAPALLGGEAGTTGLVAYNLRTTAVRALLSGLAAFVGARVGGRVGASALAAALAVDLWLFGHHYVVPLKAQSLLSANARIFEAVEGEPYDARWAPLQLDYTVGAAALLENQSMAARAPCAGGYGPLFLQHYAELAALSAADDVAVDTPFVDFPSFATGRPWVLDLLNARYVVTTGDYPRGAMLLDGAVRVYENPGARLRAFWVGQAVRGAGRVEILEYLSGEAFDPGSEVVLLDAGATHTASSREGGEVAVLAYSPERIELDVTAPADGWVVVADTYYPGWRAWVGGEETPVLQADWALRAVSVPAGQSSVILEYRSRLFEAGAWVSALGAGALVLAAVLEGARSRSGRRSARRPPIAS